MSAFGRIVYAACLAGVVAGLILTAVQRLQVVPIILAAETYESSAAPAGGHEHEHDGDAWAPADGFERTAYTALANVGMAIGFGLLLCAAYTLRRGTDWRRGALWGLAGFAVFFANPSLGLHPELPGSFAAGLSARQAWWASTVLCTAVGLGLITLQRRWWLRTVGAVLLALPHLIGAPHPPTAGGLAPDSLARQFVIATTVANAIFWVVLGATSAAAFKRLAK